MANTAKKNTTKKIVGDRQRLGKRESRWKLIAEIQYFFSWSIGKKTNPRLIKPLNIHKIRPNAQRKN